MKKRCIAILLALCMAVGLLPLTVFAEPEMTTWLDTDESGRYIYADFSWLQEGVGDSAENPYVLDSAEAMAGFAAVVDSTADRQLTDKNGITVTGRTFTGEYVRLACDLDLTTHAWVSPGNPSAYNENTPLPEGETLLPTLPTFDGTFDGNGKTVTLAHFARGVAMSPLGFYAGFFNSVFCNGTVKNLTLAGNFSYQQMESGWEDFGWFGGVTLNNAGLLENCRNEMDVHLWSKDNSYMFSWYFGAAGIAFWNRGVIRNCSNVGEILVRTHLSHAYAGGITAYNYGTVANCYNAGAVSALVYISQMPTLHAGGIASENYGDVFNCVNYGALQAREAYNMDVPTDNSETDVDTDQLCGGILAAQVNETAGGTVENCYYLDTVAASGVGVNAYGKDCSGVVSKTAAQMQSADFVATLNANAANYAQIPLADWANDPETAMPVFASELPVHTHSLKKVAAQAATEAQAGNREYYICETCGKWYWDAAGTSEITDKTAVVLPARGKVITENPEIPRTGGESAAAWLWLFAFGGMCAVLCKRQKRF